MMWLDQASSRRCDLPYPAMAGMPFTQQPVAISVADPGRGAGRNAEDVEAQGEFGDVKSREVEMLLEMYKSKLDALLNLFGYVPPCASLHPRTPSLSFQDREQGREAAGSIPLVQAKSIFVQALPPPPPQNSNARLNFPA
jgi:hypothetical protein